MAQLLVNSFILKKYLCKSYTNIITMSKKILDIFNNKIYLQYNIAKQMLGSSSIKSKR